MAAACRPLCRFPVARKIIPRQTFRRGRRSPPATGAPIGHAQCGHDLDMVCRSSPIAPVRRPRPPALGGPPMLAFVRAPLAAALVLLLPPPAVAADKPFKRDDLADAAIKLEAQIKAEAGQVSKGAPA